MKYLGSRISDLGKGTPVFVLAGVLLLSDQALKHLLSGFLRTYCNPHGPWGMPADNGLWIAVMVAVLSATAYFSRKVNVPVSRVAFALILGGGLSNLADRVVSGCVRDFPLIGGFPAFNLADGYLTIGAAFLVGRLLLRDRKVPSGDGR